MFQDPIDEDCIFNISKVHSRLKPNFDSLNSQSHPTESNRTHGSGSHRSTTGRSDSKPDESRKAKLILILSVAGLVLYFFIMGMTCFIRNRMRKQQRQREQRRIGVSSTKKHVGQFPLIVFMEANQAIDFPDDPEPKCGICFERLRSHTRVRRLSKTFIYSSFDSIRFLPDCSHYFHVSCLNSWILNHERCPLCRQQIFPPTISMISAGLFVKPELLANTSILSDGP